MKFIFDAFEFLIKLLGFFYWWWWGGGGGVMCQHEHLFVASEIKLSLHKKNKQLWHSH